MTLTAGVALTVAPGAETGHVRPSCSPDALVTRRWDSPVCSCRRAWCRIDRSVRVARATDGCAVAVPLATTGAVHTPADHIGADGAGLAAGRLVAGGARSGPPRAYWWRLSGVPPEEGGVSASAREASGSLSDRRRHRFRSSARRDRRPRTRRASRDLPPLDPLVPPVWLATKFLAGDGAYVTWRRREADVRALDVVTPTNTVRVPVVDGTFIWIAPADSSDQRRWTTRRGVQVSREVLTTPSCVWTVRRTSLHLAAARDSKRCAPPA